MNGAMAVIFAGVLLTMLAFGFALFGGGSPRDRLRKRAQILAETGSTTERIKAAVGGGGGIRRAEARGFRSLEGAAKRFLPRQSMLRERLARTGRNISLGTYLSINIGVVVVGFVAAMIAGLTPALAVPIALAGGLGIPHIVVGFLAGRRRKKFLAVFPEAVDLIVRGLKSGLPISESMTAVGREMADPVGGEFRGIMEKVRFGSELEEVMWQTAARLAIPEYNFFVISLSIQRETGGNLAETLQNLSEILRRRRQMRLKIKALSAEARASAYILGSLPFIMFALVNLLNPEYAGELFTDPRGLMMIGAGCTSMLVGVAVMVKMVRFEI
jgi:tight adherence protein B